MKQQQLMRDLVKVVIESGLSYEKIGAGSGVSHHAISLWMNGQAMPRVALLIDVLDFLGYDLKIVKRKDSK